MPKKKSKGWVKAVIGGQFGDEGKGKIVDFLSQEANVVVRFNGGGNAGHTVQNERGDFKLRTVPVGILNEHTRLNVIGSGTALSLEVLVGEIKSLVEKGVDCSSIRIDKAAHLVLPYHITEDLLEEQSRGDNRIGTTGSGIGPCYADKYRREGLRAGDLLDFGNFRKKFQRNYQKKLRLFGEFYKLNRWNPNRQQEYLEEFEEQFRYLAGYFGGLDQLIVNTAPVLWDEMDNGANVLLEGAQGFLLDIDHGSYPYVTSSNTGITAAAEGSGIAPREITEVIGVVKAYMTRVGRGPFPTEASKEDAYRLREAGNEYGTVTGRPRRCGWFDAPLLKLVARMNGFTSLAVTRLDILDEMEDLLIRVPNAKGGEYIDAIEALIYPPSIFSEGARALKYMKGWSPKEKVRGVKTWSGLPERAKIYLKIISCGLPIKFVGVGPRREETITV